MGIDNTTTEYLSQWPIIMIERHEKLRCMDGSP